MPSAPPNAVTSMMTGFWSFTQMIPAITPAMRPRMPANVFERDAKSETRRPHTKSEVIMAVTRKEDRVISLDARAASTKPKKSVTKRMIADSSVNKRRSQIRCLPQSRKKDGSPRNTEGRIGSAKRWTKECRPQSDHSEKGAGCQVCRQPVRAIPP